MVYISFHRLSTFSTKGCTQDPSRRPCDWTQTQRPQEQRARERVTPSTSPYYYDSCVCLCACVDYNNAISWLLVRSEKFFSHPRQISTTNALLLLLFGNVLSASLSVYISSYPHGGYVTLGLWFAVLGGIAASWYSFASCRFVVLTFGSDAGGFGDMFDARVGGTVLTQYQIGAGLFSWLQPYNRRGEISWTEGRCTGYTRTQRDEGFGDATFEAVRVLAVVSVLLSILLLLWLILVMCVSMGKCYIRLLSTTLFLVMTTTCLTFLILQSGLCTNVGIDTECSVDEGGLVAVAGVILWFVALVISVLFVVPVGEDLILVEGELRSDFLERQAARKRWNDERQQKQRERRMAREEEAVLRREERLRRQREAKRTPTKSGISDNHHQANTPDTIATVEGHNGETEVYIRRRLDNIEHMVDDDDDDDDSYRYGEV